MIPEVDKTIYERPVELLQQLIRFDTSNPPGNERDCIAYISHLLDAVGIKTHLFSKDPHRPNLVARLKGRRSGDGDALLLYGHVDVVPVGNEKWKYPPFEGKIAEGCVWGRGALDMKGAVAAMVCAFIKAKIEGTDLPGDVVLCILSDEEVLGIFGARFMVEKHADWFKGIRYALGEFGGFSLYVGGKKFYPIQVAEKQKCVLRAIFRGQSGHGAAVVRGTAMAKLGKMLVQLEKNLLPVHITPPARMMFNAIADALPFPGGWLLRQLLKPRRTDFILNRVLKEKGIIFIPMFRNTVNPTVVRGGDADNVIPGEVEVHLDVRLLPGFEPDDVVKELRPIIGRDVELELLAYDSMPAKPDMGLFDTLADILREADPSGIPVPLLLNATTDARFFTKLGIQTYGFIPMQLPEDMNFSTAIHSVNERIPLESLEFGTHTIFQAMQRFHG
jgi:acetylornithine deacetylase/succinyl-diaminopimelate desuccinylase-like protein